MNLNKKKLSLYSLLLLVIFICFGDACKRIAQELDGNNARGVTNDNTDNLIQRIIGNKKKTASVIGKVKDIDGNIIIGAQIIYGEKNINTDRGGIFIFKNAYVHTKYANIKASANGYLPSIVTFSPSALGDVMDIVIYKANVSKIFSSSKEAQFIGEGITINIPADALAYQKDNSSFSGDFVVDVKYTPSTQNNFSFLTTGALLAVNADNRLIKINNPVSKISLFIHSNTGEELNLKKGGAGVSIKMPHNATNGDTIIWQLNTKFGIWTQNIASHKLNNNIFSTQIFSLTDFILAGEGTSFGTANFRLVNTANMPLSGVGVNIEPLNNNRLYTTNYDGTVAILGLPLSGGNSLGSFSENQKPVQDINFIINKYENSLTSTGSLPITQTAIDPQIDNFKTITLQGAVVNCNEEPLSNFPFFFIIKGNDKTGNIHTGYTNSNGTFTNYVVLNTTKKYELEYYYLDDQNTLIRGKRSIDVSADVSQVGNSIACATRNGEIIGGTPTDDSEIIIEDKQLSDLIKDRLGIPRTNKLTHNDVKNLTHLDVDITSYNKSVLNLKGLEYFVSLQKLIFIVSGTIVVKTIANMPKLKKLIELELNGMALSNYDFLEKVKSSLQRLTLLNMSIDNNLLQNQIFNRTKDNLLYLNLGENNITDANVLFDNLSSINEIVLSRNNLRTSLGTISRTISNITVLDISYMDIPSLDGLGNFKNLRQLSLAGNKVVNDLKILHGSTLQILILANTVFTPQDSRVTELRKTLSKNAQIIF